MMHLIGHYWAVAHDAILKQVACSCYHSTEERLMAQIVLWQPSIEA